MKKKKKENLIHFQLKSVLKENVDFEKNFHCNISREFLIMRENLTLLWRGLKIKNIVGTVESS